MPQGERDGVGNRGGRRQVTTVAVSNKGRGGNGSRAGEGKGRTTIVAGTKGTIAMVAGRTTLNSIITGVTFGEIVLTGLEASTLSLILGLGQLVATYPYVVTFNRGTKLEKVSVTNLLCHGRGYWKNRIFRLDSSRVKSNHRNISL